MEGTLLKWTNYYNGWQPRYFLLNEKGILSYYKSRELIHEGCKGSCLVLACEVKVHPQDFLRFDLIIPGEQFFCLKAKSQSERQRWIVALGTCKSIGNKSDANSSTTLTSTPKTAQLGSHLSAIDNELKLKVQELRLYETVLMEEIYSIKYILNESPTPDVNKLDEKTLMLNGTCDGFIQTLDQCVQLVMGNSTEIHRDQMKKLRTLSEENQSTKNLSTRKTLEKEFPFRTFFSELRQRSSQLNSMELNEIPSEQFFTICEEYLQLFDRFSHPTLMSLKDEAIKNLLILRKKFEIDRRKFVYFISMINEEIEKKTTKENHSSTMALFKIHRILLFLSRFIFEFGQSEKSVEEAFNQSYRQTLKQFHRWNQRQLFANCFRSILSTEQFLQSLSIDFPHDQQTFLEKQIKDEMIEYSNHWNWILNQLNQFFTEHQIAFDHIFS